VSSDSNLTSVLYVSAATRLLNVGELGDILESARKHNRINQITGILLYKDGNFMQLLEGPTEAVERSMIRIRDDSRHRGIIVLHKQRIETRQFPRWSMAFPDRYELTAEGLDRYRSLEPEIKPASPLGNEKAIRILTSFGSMFR
jgi:hypothetical protein